MYCLRTVIGACSPKWDVHLIFVRWNVERIEEDFGQQTYTLDCIRCRLSLFLLQLDLHLSGRQLLLQLIRFTLTCSINQWNQRLAKGWGSQSTANQARGEKSKSAKEDWSQCVRLCNLSLSGLCDWYQPGLLAAQEAARTMSTTTTSTLVFCWVGAAPVGWPLYSPRLITINAHSFEVFVLCGPS